ncbi:hypothetical protein JCM33374_g6423 [Metschnikowia sp. JCM 33374]|nr:hypothetical protein JCM33374_g6423 [Metschnikowia sp. JCM 33374]
MSSNNLRNVIQSFKCDSPEPVIASVRSAGATKVAKRSPTKRKPNNATHANAKAVNSANILKDLPPSIVADLTVVFVGFNPGVESSKQQHHYAHPTNLFWKLFNASDLLSAVLDLRETDVSKYGGVLNDIYRHGPCSARAEHDFDLINVGVGFTDLVLRCTKQAAELSQQEKAQNVPRLLGEFNLSKAPFIVFVGKGIWEVVCKYLVPKHKLTPCNFSWGIQTDAEIMRRFTSFCVYSPKVYVFPNTSGLVASMKYPEKLDLWNSLVADMRECGDGGESRKG